MAIAQVHFMSKCLMRTVTINVIVPLDTIQMPGQVPREEKPFQTLYLLHGIFGNYTDWITGTRIARQAAEKNIAVVMPSGDNRFYVDNDETGEKYGEFIGVELPSFCEKLFPLSAQREDRFIAGLSMGGYGAICNGLKYSDRFSHIAGLSSGLILDAAVNSKEDAALPINRRGYYAAVFGNLDQLIGSDKDYQALVEKLVKAGADIPRLYLACGTEDFLIEQNRAYHRFLLSNQVDVTYEEGPGGHDWQFWDTYIKRVLDWLPLSL